MTFGTRTTEMLRVKLAPMELNRLAEQQAQTWQEILRIEEERVNVAKRYVEQVRDLKTVHSRLANDVLTQSEERPVETYEQPRYSEQLVDIIRVDTNEVVRTRSMQPAERQQGLFEEQRQEKLYGDDGDETPSRTKH
jgi:hypothetical protein